MGSKKKDYYVDEILQDIDIPSLAIKHGTSNKEVIMKHIIKTAVDKIQAFWNTRSDLSVAHELDVDYLALFKERFLPSKSIDEFLSIHSHYDSSLPSTWGHSNSHRPDGIVQFTCNNEVCHLFIEVDADSKIHQREHEAYKIWSDISASIAGETSNTSAGESKSACVVRINTHAINCSRIRYESVARKDASTKGTVPATSNDGDRSEADNEFDIHHIDEVKQVYVSMHSAIAKQTIRVILTWLQKIWPKHALQEDYLLNSMTTPNAKEGAKNDYCFWVGEYQILDPDNLEIKTQMPSDCDAVTDTFEKQTEKSHNEKRLTVECWKKALLGNNFKRPPRNAASDNLFDHRLLELDLGTESEYTITPWNDTEEAEAAKKFWTGTGPWDLGRLNTKTNDQIQNCMRSQGHWVRQLFAMKEVVSQPDDPGAPEQILNDWIDIDQTPFMNVQTPVRTNRGSFREETTINFVNADQKKCSFTVQVGIFAVTIPRANVSVLDGAIQEYLRQAKTTKFNAPSEFNLNGLQALTEKTLEESLQLIQETAGNERENAKNDINKEPYLEWISAQQQHFQSKQQEIYKATIGKVPGMFYSSHVVKICSNVLQNNDSVEREKNAHLLFQNARLDHLLNVVNANSLPLSDLFPHEKGLQDWNMLIVNEQRKDSDDGFGNERRYNARILLPLLWDPLSGMLINAFLFFIRGVRQGSPGKSNLSNNKRNIRNTKFLYSTIKTLMQSDTILPDLLANHAPDRISDSSTNLNTMLLRHESRQSQLMHRDLKEYLARFKSMYCVAFCNLVKCSDTSMLHWMAKMYRKQQYKAEIDRHIVMFPIAGQAMILRMLAEAADSNPIVWNSNITFKSVKTKLNYKPGGAGSDGDSGGGGGFSGDEGYWSAGELHVDKSGNGDKDDHVNGPIDIFKRYPFTELGLCTLQYALLHEWGIRIEIGRGRQPYKYDIKCDAGTYGQILTANDNKEIGTNAINICLAYNEQKKNQTQLNLQKGDLQNGTLEFKLTKENYAHSEDATWVNLKGHKITKPVKWRYFAANEHVHEDQNKSSDKGDEWKHYEKVKIPGDKLCCYASCLYCWHQQREWEKADFTLPSAKDKVSNDPEKTHLAQMTYWNTNHTKNAWRRRQSRVHVYREDYANWIRSLRDLPNNEEAWTKWKKDNKVEFDSPYAHPIEYDNLIACLKAMTNDLTLEATIEYVLDDNQWADYQMIRWFCWSFDCNITVLYTSGATLRKQEFKCIDNTKTNTSFVYWSGHHYDVMNIKS